MRPEAASGILSSRTLRRGLYPNGWCHLARSDTAMRWRNSSGAFAQYPLDQIAVRIYEREASARTCKSCVASVSISVDFPTPV